MNEYIAFIAIFLATFMRTYLAGKAAAAKARLKKKDFEWDDAYLGSGITSLVLALIIVPLIYASFQMSYDAHPLMVFSTAFSYAFLQNEMFNKILEWYKEIRAK